MLLPTNIENLSHNEVLGLVQMQADAISLLKLNSAPKTEIETHITQLLFLKENLALKAPKSIKFDRQALESVLAKRFFVAPSFQIYGGVAGLFDYGPAGCALQNNILAVWRKHFCLEEDMLEIECTNLTPDVVLATSGHVERFADYMVSDVITGGVYRCDHLIKLILGQRIEAKIGIEATVTQQAQDFNLALKEKYEYILETLDNYQGDSLNTLLRSLAIKSPDNNNVTDPVLFNLMFPTMIGPTGQFKAFLRPETAQGHFLNFKRLLESNNDIMPFASASIGKSFRNEISPRQGLLRVREFTMAEIEHFVHPDRKGEFFCNQDHAKFQKVAANILPLYSAKAQLANEGLTSIAIGDAVKSKVVDNETLGYFMARIYLFLVRIGIDPKRIRFRQHLKNEMAHYATDCWDAEIQSSYGWIESVGCADRSAFDLTAHSKKTGEKLSARDVLDTPIIKNSTILELSKPKIGGVFKKNAAAVIGALELMRNTDGEWDVSKITEFDASLSKSGFVEIKGTDQQIYKINRDMLKLVHKTEKISVVEYTPNVIEPSFGIGRILYALLEHSFYTREQDAQRTVFKFEAQVAPTKALVLPISNNPKFTPFIEDIVSKLRTHDLSCKTDLSSNSIGRRYARSDEIGTPFAIAVDFKTLDDQTVTLRYRDSTQQVRADVESIVGAVRDVVEGRCVWEDVWSKLPHFSSTETEETQ